MPKVTIVIPSLNQAAFIGMSIRSVLCQRGPSFEVLVMDGGSTDGTWEVLREFEGQIRWESSADQGASEALNRGFSLAAGDFIGWLNSDDVYYSVDVLQRVEEAFDNYPMVDVLYGDAAVVAADDRLLRLRLLPEYDRGRLERSNIIAQPAVFMRKRVVAEEKLRALLSLDYEYWIRLGRKGYIFKHLPGLLAADRQYASRVSVRRHAEIQHEISAYKLEHGVAVQVGPLRAAFDRLKLAPLRLRGLAWIVRMLLRPPKQSHLAFPMWIDSPYRLAARQLLKSVTQVGLETRITGEDVADLS